MASWKYYCFFVAASVKYHGARPWHPGKYYCFFVAASVKYHGARPWHPGSFTASL
jgi:hypothetical protein